MLKAIFSGYSGFTALSGPTRGDVVAAVLSVSLLWMLRGQEKRRFFSTACNLPVMT